MRYRGESKAKLRGTAEEGRQRIVEASRKKVFKDAKPSKKQVATERRFKEDRRKEGQREERAKKR